MKIQFEAESIGNWAVRYKVYGGWIVNDFSGSTNDNLNNTFKTSVFVPDPEHKWEV